MSERIINARAVTEATVVLAVAEKQANKKGAAIEKSPRPLYAI